ncbi:MAG: Yip1 family protein [Chloroflexota bacterium]|nr:Yip1 family protein [Chloroflexota bacterium]
MSKADAASPHRRGAVRLLLGMIVRPRTTLEAISQEGRRAWWLPALLAVVLVALPVVAQAPITAQQSREAMSTVQEQFAEGASPEELEQMERSMSVVASPLITVVFPAVAAAAGRVVSWLVWAGALYLAGMVLGGRSTFGQMFRMVVWIWIPHALRDLLQAIYIWLSGQPILNPGLSGLVRTGQSVTEMITAPPGLGQRILSSVLSRVDLFLVWHLVLLVIGVGVTMRLARRKAVLVALGVWILLTGLSLIPVLVGAAFTQATVMGP